MKENNDFLGTAPVGGLLVKLAIPTVAAQLINMLYNIVDRIYIGHMPEDGNLALTGVGVCLPIILIVSAFAALFGSGGAPRASIEMGKRNNDEAERILGNCTVLLVVVTAALMIAVAYLLIRKIVRHPLGITAALLILGGGVGNIIDRIAHGYVVDMFDLLLFDYPVFNLADCFVVVGVILGAVYYLWFYEKYDARKKSDASDADGDK